MTTDINERFFICACHSYNHQAIFYTDLDDDRLMLSVHLNVNHGLFKRLWIGFCYAIGIKSRYGSWDEFGFKPEDENKLLRYLEANRMASQVLSCLPPDVIKEINND